MHFHFMYTFSFYTLIAHTSLAGMAYIGNIALKRHFN